MITALSNSLRRSRHNRESNPRLASTGGLLGIGAAVLTGVVATVAYRHYRYPMSGVLRGYTWTVTKYGSKSYGFEVRDPQGNGVAHGGTGNYADARSAIANYIP